MTREGGKKREKWMGKRVGLGETERKARPLLDNLTPSQAPKSSLEEAEFIESHVKVRLMVSRIHRITRKSPTYGQQNSSSHT